MKYPKRISVAWLRRHGACMDAQEEFRKLFPRGIAISRRALKRMTPEQVAFVETYLCWIGEAFGLEHLEEECWCFNFSKLADLVFGKERKRRATRLAA